MLLLILAVGSLAALEVREVPLPAEENSLEYVHVVWRHGDRTPTELFSPEDIQKWPDGLGELTAAGAAQQYRLGQWLKRRYGGWLGNKFDRNAIYVRSSDYNRTLMSALSNLAGLFPPDQPLAPGVLWQPIPVHTRPKSSDKELYEEAACPVAEREMEEQWRSAKAAAIRTRFAAELELFSRYLQLPDMELKETWKIFDNLFCEKQHNITWPVWMNASLFERVDQLYNEVSTLEFHTDTLRRLRGGTLLHEIFQRFEAKISGSLGSASKLFAYSAHDSTLAALLATFGVFYEVYPKYATCLLIEMHQVNGTRLVRVFHKNETDVDRLIEYTIPGCGAPCTIQKLGSQLDRYFPDDWEFECGLRNNYEFVYITIIFGLLITSVCFCTMFVLEKKRKAIKYRSLVRGEDNVPMLAMVDSD